eukprot:TRINITY_DN11815_c0_g1_i1.p1 TRINITY_DN11815_c0_g1~~TRINITY_DN11815_c0_g1_i1.p1  ORF type:complete len:250 (+),score=76.86 TRINITY_DN11815_c0_g1_i1:114-752(+)
MAFLASIFGPRKTPEQMMREYKRMIDKTVRELDRERAKLQQQEKKLIADMRKMARQNQMEAVKVMAKDLVRTRRYITKFYKMSAEMMAVGLKVQTMKATQTMTQAMRGVTRAMIGMNRQMNLPAMRRVMMEFEKQSEMMGMKEELMNETIDEVMDGEGNEEEETEEMISQVLDEIGLDFGRQLGTPDGAIGVKAEEKADDELQARLDKLRQG